MADILRQFEIIAATAKMVTPTKKAMVVMLTIQSSVEKATSQNKLAFAVYMLLLLLVAAVSWFVWKSGNRLQDEIRNDANARIAEANAEAAKATEGLAKSNEEVARLKQESLQTQFNLEKTKTSLLETRASVAKQQERAAKAEKDLLELRERIKPRHLSPAQRVELVRLLKLAPTGVALLTCPMGNGDACDFLTEIGNTLVEAGWKVSRDIPRVFPVSPIGIELSIRSNVVPNAPAEALDNALEAVGLQIRARGVLPGLPEPCNVRILVGAKP